MKDAALKLALASMKSIDVWLIQRGYTGLMPQEKEAITALEAALAQPAQRKPLTQDLDAPLTLNGVALYPQRTWVGLTDEQIDEIWDAVITPSNHIREFVRAIEAKLKELNT